MQSKRLRTRARAQAGVVSPRVQVNAYIASMPPRSRKALQLLRRTIRAAAPRVEEAFSYRIPCFKLDGRPLVWYAGFRSHCSLYPITSDIRRAHAKALAGYETSKGTVRLPLDAPIPVALVRRLVRARIAAMRSVGVGKKGRAVKVRSSSKRSRAQRRSPNKKRSTA